ncbi:hypothetical protein RQN30_06365 [Arcanobacterium hippocoleae]
MMRATVPSIFSALFCLPGSIFLARHVSRARYGYSAPRCSLRFAGSIASAAGSGVRDLSRDFGEKVTAAVTAKDFGQLKQLLGNPIAVETIRNDVGSGNEPVHLGQVQASNSKTQYFTIIISTTPEKEIFVHPSKDESGSWRANIP